MPYLKEIPPQYLYDLKIGSQRLQTDLHFLAKILIRMTKGYSPIIAICGEQRNGKSFIGVWLSYMIMTALGKEIDWKRNSVYDPIETITKLKNLNNEVYMLDEASSSFNKREWYKRINIAFSKIIITQARKTLCYIFISPFVNDIDKSFTKHFDFIITVQSRGDIKVFKIVKKFEETKENKNYRSFQDIVRVPLTCVPKDLWNKYKKFSNIEKDRIEDMISKEQLNDMKKEENVNDIKAILRRM